MAKQSIRDVDVRSKRILVRVDFNVPLDKATGEVADDTRIRAVLPTIRLLQEQSARIVLCSHLGRPDGRVVEALRLAPVARRLAALLGAAVVTADDCVGGDAEAAAAALPSGGVLLLENLRFHPEEERNDTAFARQLARLGDIFVNDAFGTAHRAHASTSGVAAFLPAVAGLLLEKELAFIGGALDRPQRPFVAVLGGAKVSDKIRVVENLLAKVDTLVIGGGMANAFLVAQGRDVGGSRVDSGDPGHARRALDRAKELDVRVLLPVDAVVAARFERDAECAIVPVDKVPVGWAILDIGPQSQTMYGAAVRAAKLVIWNGPMGVFEWPAFAAGTRSLAEAMGATSATTIVGGGETTQAVEEMGVADRISYVSTGGGATLEFLEGRVLPGVAALMDG
ncbi:MAG: phosphoglycerate kinase [Dehalococcoidia bacterium]|nr:phosphoglycerate kinase [Dehalococcoidia bacterium]